MLVRELLAEDTTDFVQRWMKHSNLVAQIQTNLFTKNVAEDPDFKAQLDALPPGVEDAIWADVGGALNRDTENLKIEREQEAARNRANKPRPTLRRVK